MGGTIYESYEKYIAKLLRDIKKEYTMCEHCCKKAKKDPEDYVINNDNDVEFIKSSNGTYYKSKDIRSYWVLHNSLTNEHLVQAITITGPVTIEKFTSESEAKEFLADLIENHLSE